METNEILKVILDKISQMDKRFDDIDKRFDDIDKRFDDIDKRFDDIDKRFDILERKVDGIAEQTAILMEFRTQTTKDIAELKEEKGIKVVEEILENIKNKRK